MKLSWVATGCLLLTLSANVGQAQTSSSTSSNTLSTALLQQIKNNTDAILQRLNNLPAAITAMQSLSNILTQFQTDATQKVDKTNSQTANLTQTQSDMNKLANLFQDGNPLAEPAQQNNDLDTAITQYNAALLNVQRQGLANSLQMDPSALTYNQKTANAVMAAYPDIDRLSYVNALNTDPRLALGPIFTPKVDANDSRTNFILSASGINFAHSLPIQLGEKAKPLEKNYKDLYNLVNAAQSFNGYVLTKYLNRQSDMNTAQTHLYRKAGSATFLQSIGSEPIGLVLRDILLFQSQSYVLQQQAIEINREMLMAQVMTNALLVAHLRDYESTLYYKLRSA